MAPKCGVCHDSDSKYKCPTCELRYCSIACYKSHKPIHETAPQAPAPESSSPRPASAPTPSNPEPQTAASKPGTHKASRTTAFETLAADPTFHALFARYPRLRAQLQLIYALTLEPSADEARSWNRAVRWNQTPGSSSEPRRSTRGRRGGRAAGGGDGRGSRGTGRGGRRENGFPEHRHVRQPPEDPNLFGQWTREKGEKLGLAVLRRMRKGGQGGGDGGENREDDDEDDDYDGDKNDLAEGMAEFVQLCQMRVGGGGGELQG